MAILTCKGQDNQAHSQKGKVELILLRILRLTGSCNISQTLVLAVHNSNAGFLATLQMLRLNMLAEMVGPDVAIST